MCNVYRALEEESLEQQTAVERMPQYVKVDAMKRQGSMQHQSIVVSVLIEKDPDL